MRVRDIERYLSREMQPEERVAFEEEMGKNPSLGLDVQLLACIIQKTRQVYHEEDLQMKDLLCSAKREYETLLRPQEDLSEMPFNIAASVYDPGESLFLSCQQTYMNEVLPYVEDGKPNLYLSNISSDPGLCAFVQSMLTNEEGTTILNIVKECLSRYGLVYRGMKVRDWINVVQDHVFELTQCKGLKPYEYFVCSTETPDE